MTSEVRSLHAFAAQPDSQGSYRQLCGGQVSVPAPPRFLFGDVPHDLMRRYYGETLSLPVGLYTASGLDLFHTSLLWCGETVLQCDEIQMHQGILPPCLAYYSSVRDSIRTRYVPGQCVLLLGPGHRIYGHWLVDFLPKLFVLHRTGYDVMKLRYLVPADTPAFGIALLDLLGITAEKRTAYDQDHELIRADELLIPTMVRTNSRTSPLFGEAVQFARTLIRERNAKPAVADGMSRIFVSRARAGRDSRRLLNRDRIERMAEDAGFSIVHPEQMPLLEQFALFGQARQIVGEYGSAMHGSIFSPAGTTVGLLRGSGSPIAGFLQSAVGDALAQPTGYVIGETVANDPLECFAVSEDAFRTCLDLVFSGNRFAGQVPE